MIPSQWPRLFNPMAQTLQPDPTIKGWETPAVLQTQGLFHCLTTPAPTAQGRPAPSHSQVDPATWHRWEQGNRQYPPWQYQAKYLTRPDDGVWQPVTPLQRERMMGLPDDFTLIHPNHPDDRARNTMLGNTWHVPSAVWLLFLLLLQPSITLATPIKVTTLQKMTSIWLASQTPWGPPTDPPSFPQYDWMSHLRWTREHIAQLHVPPVMDCTVHWALSQQTQLPNIHQIRLDVIEIADIQQLVSDWHDHTHDWVTSLPPHCQIAYRQPKMITQIPVLIYLLQQIGYTHADVLAVELSQGFQVLGQLQPGLNWHIRPDQKYTKPISRTELSQHNREYVLKKLHTMRVDDYWSQMADEIATEVQQGRMAGPFTAPQWWPIPAVPLRTHAHTNTLLPLPHSDPIIAVAFSIHQTGSDGKPKIRRGEDWRRSGHNQACQMNDQPFHHTPDHYSWLIQHSTSQHPEQHAIWGHDHDGAYRQLPLAEPSVAYALLITPDGPTLWHQHVLLFGSAASVWAYNRFGDVLSSHHIEPDFDSHTSPTLR